MRNINYLRYDIYKVFPYLLTSIIEILYISRITVVYGEPVAVLFLFVL